MPMSARWTPVARALLAAADMLDADVLTAPLAERYAGWDWLEGAPFSQVSARSPSLRTGAISADWIRSHARDVRNSGILGQPVR